MAGSLLSCPHCSDAQLAPESVPTPPAPFSSLHRLISQHSLRVVWSWVMVLSQDLWAKDLCGQTQGLCRTSVIPLLSWKPSLCLARAASHLLPGLEGCHLWRAPVGFRGGERREDREFITPAPSLQDHQGLVVSLYPRLPTVRQPSPHCYSLWGLPTPASPGMLSVSINPVYTFENKPLNSHQVIQGEAVISLLPGPEQIKYRPLKKDLTLQ